MKKNNKQIVGRNLFPSGLAQPAGSCRFGMDALLLAAAAVFASPADRALRIAEIGCGCGAAILGFALKRPKAICIGLEREVELVDAARENARALGLEDRCQFVQSDLGSFSGAASSWPETADMVLANPPWRDPAAGKISPHRLRARALWLEPGTFEAFCGAARVLLNRDGLFCSVLPKDKLEAFVQEAAGHGLWPAWGMRARPFADRPPARFLLFFQKKHSSAFRWHSEIILRQRSGAESAWTDSALEFCPWLAGGK